MKILLIRAVPRPLPSGAVSALEMIWREQAPECALFAGGAATEELAARLSVRLNVPCCTGVFSARSKECGFAAFRRVYGGELAAEYDLPVPCIIVSDKNIDPADIGLQGEFLKIEPEYRPDSWYEEFETGADETSGQLKSATRIIAAGRGIKSKTQFQKVSELADRLGAVAGATRPVVYNGWAPHSLQIGVSGVSVDPEMCLIIAASGSQAFLGAIGKNTKIIAINSDPEAPVFRRANWGVIGDVSQILSELLKLTD